MKNYCTTRPRQKNGRRIPGSAGFTLVELLVVVAIIALLVAILVPALTKATELTKRTVCLTQLNQASLGLHMYAQEYDNSLPTSLDHYFLATPAVYGYYQQLYESETTRATFLSIMALLVIALSAMFCCSADSSYVSFDSQQINRN